MNQIFPVFDPITEQCLYFKTRELVHTEGDWHRGVQANIIRLNNSGSFDILVQERSNTVDIGGQKFDQSLATQMLNIDNQLTEHTLRRGLRNELNVRNYRAVKINRKLRIVKTYEEHPGTLNRELVSLFIVTLPPNEPLKAVSDKVEGLSWMEWDDFLEFFRKNQRRFTKTAQFYFSEPELLSEIGIQSRQILGLPVNSSPCFGDQPLIHIDRWPTKAQTYTGDIAKCLELVGESRVVSLSNKKQKIEIA